MPASSGTPQDTKQKTAATYNAASDVYDNSANSFWTTSDSARWNGSSSRQVRAYLMYVAEAVLDLGLPPEIFDAVVCIFGIFFVPDMQAAVTGR